MTEKKSSKFIKYAILTVAILIILWLLLRNNDKAQQVVKQYAPWALPLISPSYETPNYNISLGGYVPANMSPTKCDSNSPCVFCSIPNASYPTKPVTIAKQIPPTDYIKAPVTTWSQQPYVPDYVLSIRQDI